MIDYTETTDRIYHVDTLIGGLENKNSGSSFAGNVRLVFEIHRINSVVYMET